MRRRHGTIHMRCCREKCKKRFKGREGDVCPACSGRAKPDVWAAKKEWRAQTCVCNGQAYTPERDYTGHRRGSRGCIHHGGDALEIELPGAGEEFPF